MANGTLTVSNFGVAKQATSLPSSSTSNSAGPTDDVNREVEGAAPPVVEREEDTVSFVSTRNAQAQAAPQTEGPQDISASAADASQQTLREAVEKERESEKERLEELAKEINDKLNDSLALRFGEDKETGVDYFQLIEKESGDVVRQVPTKEILEFMKKFQDFSGLLVSQQA